MRITGCSTSKHIARIKQPEGGYLPLKMFEVTPVEDNDDEYIDVLNPEENVSPDLINTTVDHMTRFGLGLRAEYAFTESLASAVPLFVPLLAEAWNLIPDIKCINGWSSFT